MNNLPKKKKSIINPFSCFMKDFQENQKKSGIFYKSMQEVCSAAKPHWDDMSEERRDFYKEQAKLEKEKNKEAATKFTSVGIPFDEMQRRRHEEKKLNEKMKQEIQNLLQTAFFRENLVDLIFYFISTTDFCQTLQGDIFPAELAMVKFSLREGVIDSMHMLINPGKLPLGSFGEALDKSNAGHKLPVPPDAKGISDYYDIQRRIFNFLGGDRSGRNLPILYTHYKELKNAKLTINKIVNEVGNDVELTIYPLEEMFSALKMFTMKIKNDQLNKPLLADKVIVRDVLDRDTYAYSTGIGCEFHDEVDSSVHCCLSKAKRWAFSIADYCYKDLVGVEYKLGKHLPINANLDSLKEKPVDKTSKDLKKEEVLVEVSEEKKEVDTWSRPSFQSTSRISFKIPDRVASTITVYSTSNDLKSGSKLSSDVEKPKDFMNYNTTTVGRGLMFLPKTQKKETRSAGRGAGITKFD